MTLCGFFISYPVKADTFGCNLQGSEYQCYFYNQTPGAFNCTIINAPNSQRVLIQSTPYPFTGNTSEMVTDVNFINSYYFLPKLLQNQEIVVTLTLVGVKINEATDPQISCQHGEGGRMGY